MADFHGGIASCIEGRGLVFASPARPMGPVLRAALASRGSAVQPIPAVLRLAPL